MSSITLSSIESAALAWLAESTFAHAPQAVRLPDGPLCIDYWHAPYQSYGALIVVETISADDMLNLITITERRIAERQHHDIETHVAEGGSRSEAYAAAHGYPTRAALCVPLEEVSEMVYEAYLRASGTFDEPMVIAVWDGSTWSFDQEEAE
jgi:hypothetical protein